MGFENPYIINVDLAPHANPAAEVCGLTGIVARTSTPKQPEVKLWRLPQNIGKRRYWHPYQGFRIFIMRTVNHSATQRLQGQCREANVAFGEESRT
jgi:hypothetical protein